MIEAPELLRWAFGVLVYFALYGRYPFDGNNVREILLTVLHGTIEWDSDVSRLQPVLFLATCEKPPRATVAPALRQVQIDSKTIAFLKGCLNRKPRKRTTAKAGPSACSYQYIYIYLSLYIYIYVCVDILPLYMYVCNVCMYVLLYLCIYVCMMYVYIYTHTCVSVFIFCCCRLP